MNSLRKNGTMSSGRRGTRYLQDDFTIKGNIYEEEFWTNLFKFLNSIKDNIYSESSVEVSTGSQKVKNTKFSNEDRYTSLDDFSIDWENFINHLKNKKNEYLKIFDDDFLENIKSNTNNT